MLIVYGIPNCDTCRKARRWLEEEGIEHRFHDFRVDGIDREQVERWLDVIPVDKLVNRRSTTWRQLDAPTRELIGGAETATLLAGQPTLIKSLSSRQVIGYWSDSIRPPARFSAPAADFFAAAAQEISGRPAAELAQPMRPVT